SVVGRGWGGGWSFWRTERNNFHPPPQPSPTRGEGAHRACDEVCGSIRQEHALASRSVTSRTVITGSPLSRERQCLRVQVFPEKIHRQRQRAVGLGLWIGLA